MSCDGMKPRGVYAGSPSTSAPSSAAVEQQSTKHATPASSTPTKPRVAVGGGLKPAVEQVEAHAQDPVDRPAQGHSQASAPTQRRRPGRGRPGLDAQHLRQSSTSVASGEPPAACTVAFAGAPDSSGPRYV